MVLFITDRALGLVFAHLTKTQKAGKYTASNIAFTKANEDVIVFGPSTGRNNYDVPLISQALKLPVRSVAEPAMCPIFHDVQLHFILKRYIPKLIVIDIRSQELIGKGFEQAALISQVLPYYSNAAKENFKILDGLDDFKSAVLKARISSVYKYNSQLLYLLQANYAPGGDDEKILKLKGYEPLLAKPEDRLLKMEFSDYGFGNTKPDQLIYDSFYDFVNTAQKKGVKVVVVIPPKFYKTNDQEIVNNFKKQVQKRYGSILYDFSIDTTFANHPELFANRLHLNNIGADVFTRKMVTIIKDKLKTGSNNN
ncbi:hypothetical protein SAMN04487890_111160 [Mucilaginibacter polytrichastri]|nr:hypothetical protein SAMN04487890_111160 [Mucilaginibacter polytrichastri]